MRTTTEDAPVLDLDELEPAAGERVEDNLNPAGRAFYAFSTLLRTPCSLSQDVGLALGAQAGEARICDVVTSTGFLGFAREAVQYPDEARRCASPHQEGGD